MMVLLAGQLDLRKELGSDKLRIEFGNPPKWGALTLNINGACMEGTNEGAIACVCRDSSGLLADGFARTVMMSFAAHTEATPLLETLTSFISRSSTFLELNSDQFDPINCLSGKEEASWEVSLLTKEAHAQLNFYFDFKAAQANKVAD